MTIGRKVTMAAAQMLAAPGGLASAVRSVSAELAVAEPATARIFQSQIAADTLDRGAGGTYPAVHVYCEKAENKLREKFRTFSGTVNLAIEVRATSDRVETVELERDLFVEAILLVLHAGRGDWGGGMFHGGEYVAEYSPVRHGGKNYLATAKVKLAVNVSVD